MAANDQQPEPASAAAVDRLAQELEALRRAIGPLLGLQGQLDDLAAAVAQLVEDAAVRATSHAAAAPLSLIGLGSVCRRQATGEAAPIVAGRWSR